MRRSGLGDIAIQGRILIKQILDDIAAFPEIISDKDYEIDRVQNDIAEVVDTIHDLNIELQNFDEEDIKRKNQELLDVTKDLGSRSADLSRYEDGLKKNEKDKITIYYVYRFMFIYYWL